MRQPAVRGQWGELQLKRAVELAGMLEQDPQLIEAISNERVVIATPSSPIALLRLLALGWREQALAVNALR